MQEEEEVTDLTHTCQNHEAEITYILRHPIHLLPDVDEIVHCDALTGEGWKTETRPLYRLMECLHCLLCGRCHRLLLFASRNKIK